MKDNKELLDNGLIVEGKLISSERIVINTKVWNYKIVCEWEDPKDGMKYTFEKTFPIWVDPKEIMEKNNMLTIPIALNPEDYSNYYIDTKFIEDQVIDLTQYFDAFSASRM